MYKPIQIALLFVVGILANPLDNLLHYHKRAIQVGVPQPRQEPTAFTTARTANTQFAPPATVTPADPSATGTQTTTHEANTEIIPATTTGTPPPLITTDSRTANTQAVLPSTPSSAFAVPSGRGGLEVVMVAVAAGIAAI